MNATAIAAWDPDEVPTKKSDNYPTPMLLLAARVDRLAELAIERLTLEFSADESRSTEQPGAHSLAEALADLAEIRALASKVMR